MTQNSILVQTAQSCQCVDLWTRKLITAHLSIARVLAPITFPPTLAEDDMALASLVDYAAGAAKRVDALSDGHSTADYLNSYFSKLEGYLLQETQNPGERCRGILAVLENELQLALGHEQASGASGEVHGLRELFEFVVAEVIAAYRRILQPGSTSGEVKLVVGGNGLPKISATTEFPTADNAVYRSSEVHLSFPRGQFSPSDVSRLLAIMFHETFVHVMQDLNRTGTRIAFGEECPLSEGFVDRAGFEVLGELLKSATLPGRWADLHDTFFQGRLEAQADRMRHAETVEADDALVRRARNLGRRVFDRLSRMKGTAWASRLAMLLNVSAMDGDQRYRVMAGLDEIIGSDAATRTLLGELEMIVEGGSPAKILLGPNGILMQLR